MDLQIRITYPAAQVEEWSDYYVLLHDFETSVWHYKPRSMFSDTDRQDNDKGYPETVPFVNRQGVEWTDRMVRYMFDLCCLSKYGFVYKSIGWQRLPLSEKRKLAAEFETAFDSGRFATNGSGLDRRYNPIGVEVLGEPPRTTLAKQWEVACGGNIVKAVSHNPVGVMTVDETGSRSKVDCLEVVTWDGHNPAPDALGFNWRTHPHLVHMATIATPEPYGDRWKVTPFSFFSGHGTPYTMLFSSPNFVPLHRVRRLKKSELANRSPYYP